MEQSLLSCGHPLSPHSAVTTGYAELDGRRVCYDCADAHERAALLTERRMVAYLSGDGERLTTWTGGLLANVTRRHVARNNFSRDGIVKFRAVDVHGQRWYGTSPGCGMYARMHRAK